MNDGRICTKCTTFKPSTEFNLRNGHLKSWCKRCNSLRNVVSSYGISVAEYDAMLERQEYRCALCDGHEDSVGRRNAKYRSLVVDHDHVTGSVRGLLCHNCNVLLGHAQDKEEILNKAINYLRRVSKR